MKTVLITVFAILAVASAWNLASLMKLGNKIVHAQQNTKSNSVPESPTDVAQVVKGNSDLAFDLFKAVSNSKNQDNLIFSPYSISDAMAMTFAGANGKTKKQMKKRLHFNNKNLHAVFRDLNSRLFKSGEGVEMKLANSFWGDQQYHFKQEFVDLVRNNYQGEVRSVDFAKDAETSRLAINEWTSTQTNGKINDLLAQVDPLTKLILVNAIYFKGEWENAFLSAAKGQFTTLNSATQEVDMMEVTQTVNYFQGSGFKSVTLPYKGKTTSMTVILPDESKFAEIKKSLNTDTLSKVFDNKEQSKVSVKMPKFKIESALELKDTFKKLGLSTPFKSGKADFSGMDGTKNLAIGSIVHKAFIEVNEKGTEAAAATAIVMVTRSIELPPVKFTADRPFFFVIHDENNSVLFMGQVVSP